MKKARLFRVGVIFGGRSGEHEVSLASARNVMEALGKAGHTVIPIGITPHGRWLTDGRVLLQLGGQTSQTQEAALTIVNDDLNDNGDDGDAWALLPQGAGNARLPAIDVVFPVLHGPYGEDGTVQGLLEIANIPYVGSGVLASAAAMDKAVARQIFAQAGIRQTPYQMVLRKRWQTEPDGVLSEVEGQLDYPLFVKPANLGSSIGVSKARNASELGEAITLACRFDRKVLVEEAVPNAREIEVSVLGNDEPIVSIPGEIVPGNEFYDYAAKYLDDNSDLLIPAPLGEAQVHEVQDMALRAYGAVDCAGLARVDFLLDDASGTFYLNEINTMPGFTRISMYPKLWEASGISYPELVDRLVELAVERHADRMQNATTRTPGQDTSR
jgi:D-alanine-D-alanine ligase